ncbi:hypothetical protein [Ralstonia pseudosolanacearum]
MDTDNQFWRNEDTQQQYDQLMQLMACPVDSDQQTTAQVDAVACNYFVAKAVDTLYGVSDFSPSGGGAGAWLSANAIGDYVQTHKDTWSKLGNADNQQVLQDAASGAANGQPVIAVMKGNPHGHVALVLGGELKASTTWVSDTDDNMRVPNSAAFSLEHVDKAYVFCRLSAAFTDPSNVEIYWRVK